MIVPKSLDNIYCHIKRIADSGKDFKPGSTLRITLDKCREAVSTMLSKPISTEKAQENALQESLWPTVRD